MHWGVGLFESVRGQDSDVVFTRGGVFLCTVVAPEC